MMSAKDKLGKRKAIDVDVDDEQHEVLVPEPTPAPASCVGSRLRLTKLLQTGAHGRVYQAYLTSSPDTYIAVKVTVTPRDVDSRREPLAVRARTVLACVYEPPGHLHALQRA